MLDLDQLLKTFNPGTPNEVRALRGVSLRLERGSFLIIIGTNGSGKSTLLNAVAGTFLVDTGRITPAKPSASSFFWSSARFSSPQRTWSPVITLPLPKRSCARLTPSTPSIDAISPRMYST